MKLLHLKRRFYEARLTAYEAALRAMKRTFGAWSEALTGFMFFCPKFGQKILEKPSNWNLPAQEELFSPLLL